MSQNWTQKELSAQLGLTPKMISFYENNERVPPADILIKLAGIFQVPSDYLLGLSTEFDFEISKKKITVSEEEHTLITLYRRLDRDYKDILIGELKKCIKMQEQEYHTHSHRNQKKQA